MTIQPLRIGYVLKRFPRLSETFILNEMLELEKQGVHVEVFSLLKPPADEARHALLSDLKARITYLPSASSVAELSVKRGQANGDSQKFPLADLAGSSVFDVAMPGKSAGAKAALVYMAATVAMLARDSALDHLHAHFGSDATTVAMLAGRLALLPYSFTAHAKDIYHTYIDPLTDNRMRAAKMEAAAFVATVSDFNQKHLAGLLPKPAQNKVQRIYNGIDLGRFSYVRRNRAPAHIISVGRLVEKKGFSDLIEACHLLRDDGGDFTCDIIGDGPLHETLSRQAHAAGLSNIVRLLGAKPQEEVMHAMRTATALVLPCIVTPSGDRDGLPTVLLEALASGLPCISTTVAGVPEILVDGISGRLVEPGQPSQLAAAIRELLLSNELQESFARNGRSKAERDFDVISNVRMLRRNFQQNISRLEDTHAHLLRVG